MREDSIIDPKAMSFEEMVTFIRATFYPRWDRMLHWKIIDGYFNHGAGGRCEAKDKTITINTDRIINIQKQGNAGVFITIVHEIAHAVINPYHGIRFLDKLRQCSKIAESIGLYTVRDLLLEEVSSYQKVHTHPSIVSDCYNTIQDSVVENGEKFLSGAMTLDDVLLSLAHELGMEIDELKKRLKRAEKLFAKALKEYSELRAARAKM